MHLPSLYRAAALVLLAGSTVAAQQLPNGVASGDTTQTSSVLWARASVPGTLTFEYSTDAGFGSILGTQAVGVADPLAPERWLVPGLTPSTQYFYRATDAAGLTSSGTFRTSAPTNVRTGFHFGVSGDWRGELAPYPSVRNVTSRNLELWVSLGDTIYADVASPALPLDQAVTVNDFRLKHNEVYSTRFGLNTLADIRGSMSTLAMIDDHEVTNDFAGGAHPSSDPRFAGQGGNYINETSLYTNGVSVFREYNPQVSIDYSGTGDPRLDGKPKLGRANVYGKDAAVITSDARSFRDQELAPADPTNPASVAAFLAASFNPARTMLGDPQLQDIKNSLLAAQNGGQTWKFVMVPEPIQNLGVLAASDRFEGYAAERTELLKFIDDNNIENVVFVSADIHGTLVNNLTYQNGPFQPQIQTGAIEITTGSVAYEAPFGPTVAGLASALGIPGTIDIGTYLSLPGLQQEAYIQGLLNAQLNQLGYSPLGLEDSGLDYELLQGTWSATNSYGWTEFDIDPLTQLLTVTTWGIPWYTEEFLLANPQLIAGLQPSILQQFTLAPVPAPGAAGLLGLGGIVAARRRRR
jgi:phosphodiesterase/alkaline phosphatase D-like protein